MRKEYFCEKCGERVNGKEKTKWCQFSKAALRVGFIQKECMRIVGESRDKKFWWITWTGVKSKYCFTKDYIKEIK